MEGLRALTLFRGLSAFPITPADSEGHVDTQGLGVLLRRLTQAGVDSIGLLGSTGSYPYLSREERRRAIEAAVEVVDGQTPLLVGVGALRTSDAVNLARDAKAAGAGAGLLAPMSYTPLTDAEVFTHFETIAGESGLPICIYNNPVSTHFTFSQDLLARLSQLDGVVAVKNPAPDLAYVTDMLENLRGRAPAGFSVGFSTDWNAAEAMLAGGDAWYSVLAGLFPEPCMRMRAAASAGDAAETRRINSQLQPVWDLFTRFTSLRVAYAAANILGLTQAQPPRPILPLDDSARLQVAKTLAALDLS